MEVKIRKTTGRASGCMLVALAIAAPVAAHDCRVVGNRYLRGEYHGECLEKYEVAHGHGEARGADTYVGDFVHGRPDGKGVYTWENGGRLEGTFTAGKADGAGTYVSARGTRFQGPFVRGKLVTTQREDCPRTRGPLEC
jgi:hypothetical protein